MIKLNIIYIFIEFYAIFVFASHHGCSSPKELILSIKSTIFLRLEGKPFVIILERKTCFIAE